jgi:hypothetical protein
MMINDLNKSRDERKAKGEAVGGTLHMTANHYIEFIDKDHARLHNYRITAFVPPPAAAGASGPSSACPPPDEAWTTWCASRASG